MKPYSLIKNAYNALIYGTIPIWFPYAVFHTAKRSCGFHRLKQEFGFLPKEMAESSKPRVWFHAVSAGETVASMPIVSRFSQAAPECEIIFSSTTDSGREVAEAKLPEVNHLVYFPFDLPPFVNRSLLTIHPKVFASIEAEIWPNFLCRAQSLGIKTAVLNGVFTDKTYKRAKKARHFYQWAFACIDRFCMQTQRDAERVVSLGADESKVCVVGNTKFDEPFPVLESSEKADLMAEFRFPLDSHVFVAGSTNPGEEETIVSAFIQARKALPRLRMIIAPRHLDRADYIANLVRSRGLRVGFRTKQAELSGAEDAVILDTMGELARIYAIASVSFVGGTLVPKGGHNLLQPVAQGVPVLFGTHVFKTRDVAQMILDAKVGFHAVNAEEIANYIVEFSSTPLRLLEISASATRLIESNKGAGDRCAKAVLELYGETISSGSKAYSIPAQNNFKMAGDSG